MWNSARDSERISASGENVLTESRSVVTNCVKVEALEDTFLVCTGLLLVCNLGLHPSDKEASYTP